MLNILADLSYRYRQGSAPAVGGVAVEDITNVDGLTAALERLNDAPQCVCVDITCFPIGAQITGHVLIAKLVEKMLASNQNHTLIIPYDLGEYLRTVRPEVKTAEFGDVVIKMPHFSFIDRELLPATSQVGYIVDNLITMYPRKDPRHFGNVNITEIVPTPWLLNTIITASGIRAHHAQQDSTKRYFVQYVVTFSDMEPWVIAVPVAYKSENSINRLHQDDVNYSRLPMHVKQLMCPWGWWVQKDSKSEVTG